MIFDSLIYPCNKALIVCCNGAVSITRWQWAILLYKLTLTLMPGNILLRKKIQRWCKILPQSIKGDGCLWLWKSFLTQGPDNLFCPKFRSMVSGFFFSYLTQKNPDHIVLSCNSIYLCVTIWHLWHFIFESKYTYYNGHTVSW